MSGVNKVIILGRLGKDPEIQHFEGGNVKARLVVATSEKYKDRNGQDVEQTEWHTINFWGRQAEVCEKYLKKGREIYVEGKLKTNSWDDKDGNKRYSTEIAGLSFQMIGGRPDGGSQGTQEEPVSQSAGEADFLQDPPASDDLPF